MGALVGLLTGLVPYGIDALFGTSSGITGAESKHKSKLQEIIDRLKGEAGSSPSDSLFYKTAMKLIDEKYGEQAKQLEGIGATKGLTHEQQLGNIQVSNRGRNLAQLQTLGHSDVLRKSLLDKAEGYELDKSKYEIDEAKGAAGRLSGLSTAASSGLGALISLIAGGSGGKANDVIGNSFRVKDDTDINRLGVNYT